METGTQKEKKISKRNLSGETLLNRRLFAMRDPVRDSSDIWMLCDALLGTKLLSGRTVKHMHSFCLRRL